MQQEIYISKQDSKTVTDFYSTLKVLWEELEIYMPMPNCSFRIKCCCEGMRQALKNHTLLHGVRFLTGLNDIFSVVRSQILLMEPLPSMNRIFSMVLQHERQGNFASTEESHALINVVGNKKPYVKYNNSTHPSTTSRSKVCTHCGRIGHTIDVCYGKHGFPPHFCKASMSNNVATTEGEDSSSNTSVSNTNNASPTITQDQYEALMNLLQTSSINQGNIPAVSNQVVSSTTYPPLHNEGISQNFAYKYCSSNSWIIDFRSW